MTKGKPFGRGAFASEDRETKAALDEIVAEASEETEHAKRERLAKEVLEQWSAGVRADPDKIQYAIEMCIWESPDEYPSLMDIHDGDICAIAVKVRDHMIQAELHNDSVTLRQALGRLERLAAQVKFRTVPILVPSIAVSK